MKFEDSKQLNEIIADNVNLHTILTGENIGEFETRIGKHPGYLARICKTGAEISLLTAISIADELGTTVDGLIGETFKTTAQAVLRDRKIAKLLSQKEAIEKEIEALRTD